MEFELIFLLLLDTLCFHYITLR